MKFNRLYLVSQGVSALKKGAEKPAPSSTAIQHRPLHPPPPKPPPEERPPPENPPPPKERPPPPLKLWPPLGALNDLPPPVPLGLGLGEKVPGAGPPGREGAVLKRAPPEGAIWRPPVPKFLMPPVFTEGLALATLRLKMLLALAASNLLVPPVATPLF